jgi:TolA-binding protein
MTMVDPFDEHGPSEHHSEPAPEGELPSDLFDDSAEPAEVPPGGGEHDTTDAPVEMYRGDAFSPESQPPDASPDEPKHPIFPVILGFAMLVALAIACFTNLEAAKETPPATTAPAPATASPTPETTPPAPSDSLADDVKAIKSELDGISGQVKELQAKIEGMPKAASHDVLEKLQAKVDELSKGDEAMSKKFDDLDGRVGSVDKSLAQVREEVGSLKGDVKKVSETAMASATTESRPDEAAKPADVNVEDQAVSQGADLYEAGKYKEANDTFRKATEAAPNDARVWYFAALSNGMATNQWQGETIRLVSKGVEREKAGTPDSAKIDQMFAKLPAKQKAWLEYYRKTAKK